MLVLSRKSQESVIIGQSDGFAHLLKITVLEIGSGKVRLGFEADATVPVHREEVWERMRANARVGSKGAGPPASHRVTRVGARDHT